MLLLEQDVRPLQLLQPPNLPQRRHPHVSRRAAQHPLAHLLAPLRQHERVNVQRGGHCLDLKPRLRWLGDDRSVGMGREKAEKRIGDWCRPLERGQVTCSRNHAKRGVA